MSKKKLMNLVSEMILKNIETPANDVIMKEIKRRRNKNFKIANGKFNYKS